MEIGPGPFGGLRTSDQAEALEPLERLPFTAAEAAAIVALVPEEEGLAALPPSASTPTSIWAQAALWRTTVSSTSPPMAVSTPSSRSSRASSSPRRTGEAGLDTTDGFDRLTESLGLGN